MIAENSLHNKHCFTTLSVKSVINNVLCHLSNCTALVKFESPLDLNDSCLPICLLPRNATMESGKECYVTGWGRIRADGPKFCFLREAKVRLVSNDTCNKISSYNGTIHSRALCAGTQEGGIGPCKFDSGGPLACSYGGFWYLVGIVSWGEGCGLPEKYGVYSNMFELSSWIKEIIRSKLRDTWLVYSLSKSLSYSRIKDYKH